MDVRETVAMLTWMNQVDPRVMLNESAVEAWQYALRTVAVADAKSAVLEFYRNNETASPAPGAIYKRAVSARASADARTTALEAKPRQVSNPMSWRARNPAEWDRLMAEGAESRRADLRARGLL